MEHRRTINLTEKQKKYLKLYVANLIFIGGLGLCWVIDLIFLDSTAIVGLSMLYLVLVTPIYSIVYGRFSYRVTRQILLPNLLFGLLLSCSMFFISMLSRIVPYVDYDEFRLGFLLSLLVSSVSTSGIFAGVSTIFSIITMIATKVQEKKISRLEEQMHEAVKQMKGITTEEKDSLSD